MRREFLRAYIFSLFTEGTVDFNGPGVSTKVMAVIAGDVPVVVGELLAQYAEAAGHKIGAAALNIMTQKFQGIADDLRQHGPAVAFEKLRRAWGDVQKTYKRGAEANARRGR